MSKVIAILSMLIALFVAAPSPLADDALDIGSRRELFVDDYLINPGLRRLDGVP